MQFILFFLALLSSACLAFCQTNTNFHLDWNKLNSKQKLQALRFTTPAYCNEALRLIIENANQTAENLNLPEQLPIVKSNLITSYISPPRLAQASKSFGNITTSNYVYSAFSGRGLSLVRTHLQYEYAELQKQYLWPKGQLDTNSAFQLATQFLKAASIDVDGLKHDCNCSIRAYTPEGENGAHFVPVYWVSWSKANRPIAMVELLEPSKILRQMVVEDARYVRQKPLQITNLDFLLSQTNAPAPASQ